MMSETLTAVNSGVRDDPPAPAGRSCAQRPDGWLLILEDQRMNVGELPHDKGFLVLDEVELRDLFGVSDRSPSALRVATVDDRLSLAQVSRAVLHNCDGPHVQSALRLLAKRSLDQVRRLRRAGPDPTDHRRGRAHSYYAMLHTNATLALERPGTSSLE